MVHDFKKLHNYALRYRNFRDEAAFQHIEKILRGYIATSIRRSCFRDDEDMYQETLRFIAHLITSPSWNPLKQPFDTTVRRVISNVMRHHYTAQRCNNRRVHLETSSITLMEEAGCFLATEDFEGRVLLKVTVENIFKKADPLTRECLSLLMEGYTLAEIGARVKCSKARIRYRLAALGKELLPLKEEVYSCL